MDHYARTAALSLLTLSITALFPCTFSYAQDGIIVLQRTVQPRVATRPTDIPDPRPTVVNANISQPVNQAVSGAGGGGTVSQELGDADFANITSGSGIKATIMPGGNLPGFGSAVGSGSTTHQNISGSAPGHSGGGAGSGLAGTINGTVQRGLAPLQMLGGGE
ncbi:hypothetical protein NVV93_09185 [Pseudomonas sp. LS44]|uniref:hypothetical protein n=1 Tax=Pseudomonas sp. LS44 TaxID=1357074 RepID=UPI00215A2BBD|nr:hypothetical protein [Pseudomonas sp. LS44]UVE19522.1 hypothetical protein NVV93_09185 [Pseudomonas sp. LS44]